MNLNNSVIVIRASAGTGKTFQLTNRYINLIKDGVRPEHILAVTFTRLAAGEILERILVRLANAATDKDRCAQLASELEDDSFTRERCLNLLYDLTSTMHRVRVETLDAYFAQLAHSFSLEIGLPVNWTILEEVQDRRIRLEALQQTIVDDSDRTVSRLLSILFQGEAQRSITTELLDTINELYSLYLETDPDAWRQFPDLKPLTDEKLNEAIERLDQLDYPAHRSIIKAKDQTIELARNQDWDTLISKGIPNKILHGETTYQRKELSAEIIDAYRELVDHARALFILQLRHQTDATWKILDRFHRHYTEFKHRYRGVRFDDVTHRLMVHADAAQPDQQSFRLDTQIAHLLLDEFQDTSLEQWHVIRPLAQRITGGGRSLFESAWSSFFCVGDVKQAIYGWRGGRSEIFDALKKHLEGIHEEPLNRSFRSAPVIINTVNRVFRDGIGNHENLKTVEDVVLKWCHDFPEHETALVDEPGYVRLETAPEPVTDEEKITSAMQQRETFAFAAQRVMELHEKMPERTIGVLLRRNNSVAEIIYQLRKLGIRASEERGGNPLTDSAAVQVVLSILKLADHPDDSIAAFHLATSPLAEKLDLEFGTDLAQFRQLAQSVRRDLQRDGFGLTIARWVDRLRAFCNARDRRRLQQLEELAFRFEPVATIRTADFLDFVDKERIADPLVSNIRVMTIHQSKGLEFDTVILPELEDAIDQCNQKVVWGAEDPAEKIDRVCVYRNREVQALLPDSMQQMFQEAINREANESLCLLYVALTRAAHSLYMIIAPTKSKSRAGKPENTRSVPRTLAGLLSVALAPGQPLDPETTLYEDGKPDWYQETRVKDSDRNDRFALPRQIPVRMSPDALALDFRSPSTLEGGTRVNAAGLLQPINHQALQRGTVIHGLFEMLTWIDAIPADAELLVQANRLSAGHVDSQKMVQQFRQMLDCEAVAKVLAPEYYLEPFDESVIAAIPDDFHHGNATLEVHNERTFVVADSGSMLSGTIDRLVLIFSRNRLVAADIVDFKTDRIDPDDTMAVRDRVEHYRPQIEAYQRAVGSIFGLDPERISARLVFVDAGLVQGFRPTPAPSPA